jgi:hypothetical protein
VLNCWWWKCLKLDWVRDIMLLASVPQWLVGTTWNLQKYYWECVDYPCAYDTNVLWMGSLDHLVSTRVQVTHFGAEGWRSGPPHFWLWIRCKKGVQNPYHHGVFTSMIFSFLIWLLTLLDSTIYFNVILIMFYFHLKIGSIRYFSYNLSNMNFQKYQKINKIK